MEFFVFISLIILVFLIFLSIFWSLAETSLTSLSKYRIKKIIAINKSIGEQFKQWLMAPYYILTVILVGDTLTSLAISFFATFIVVSIFSSFNRNLLEIIIWICVTIFTLIICEITPKIFARLNPERITLISLPLLSKFISIIKPVISPLIKIISFLFPNLKINPFSRLSDVSLEEMRGLIKEANFSGFLDKEASQMLQSAIRLGELEVSQIMTPIEKIEAVDLDQDQSKFLDLLVETGRSRVPVYHGDIRNVVGFVHTKDLLYIWKKNKGNFLNTLIRPAYFVSPNTKVYDILKEFQSGKSHLAFVTDALGNLLGMITLEDILEEIVGEILDEYDLKQKEKWK